MKQLLQDISNGQTLINDVPIPSIGSEELLIQTSMTLISTGTEKMLVDFGQANIFSKALQQPEKAKQALEKMSVDGIYPTLKAINNKLSDPLPLGYCNVGTVEKIGANVNNFKIGDRVVSNGFHAEYVCVSKNLCSRVPSSIQDAEAVFAVPGSIALNGIRLAAPQIGETFIVYGLGLIGLLSTQILIANGCKVVGIDFDDKRLNLAESYGASTFNPSQSSTTLESFIDEFTSSRFADGALICTASSENEIISNSAKSLRKKGRIVLIGTAGLNIQRSDFYEKELSFQVSCSYGPGRYDELYEDKGIDYPYDYVRWTASRNFDSIIQLIKSQKIDVKSMSADYVGLMDSPKIYKDLGSSLATIIKFKKENSEPMADNDITNEMSALNTFVENSDLRTSFIGAGNYASSMLIPAFKKNDFYLDSIISKNGLSGLKCQKKFGFANNLTDFDSLFKQGCPDVLVIATQHHLHSEQLLLAISKGAKNIFIEKPLCINFEQLDLIRDAVNETQEQINIMIGFNRRFAPFICKAKSMLADIRQPKFINYNVNAGYLESSHWLCDRSLGGGRLIGEACHFIDLSSFLIESKILDASVEGTSFNGSFSINLKYEDGSVANINYFVNGSKKISKEVINIHFDSQSIVIDNFRTLKHFGKKNHFTRRNFAQNKGQQESIKAFKKSINNKPAIPVSEILDNCEITLKLTEKLTSL